jgi:hypothetical protein
MTFQSYPLITKWEKIGPKGGIQRALKILRFWRLIPNRENLLAQSKRTAPPFSFQKLFHTKEEIISTGICFKKGNHFKTPLDS